MHYLRISLGVIFLKQNFRVKFPNDVIYNFKCVMPCGAAKRDSRFTVSSSSSNGPTTDAQGACSSSTTSSDCESCPIVSLLERLHVPSASELGRKRKMDANPAPPKGKKC